MRKLGVNADTVLVMGKAYSNDEGQLVVSYGASGFEVNFTGTYLDLEMYSFNGDGDGPGGNSWSPFDLAVYVDGANMPGDEKRIIINGPSGLKTVRLIDGLEYGAHTVRVFKMSRGYSWLYQANHFKARRLITDGEFHAPNPKKKIIVEAYGDSITNGDANNPGYSDSWGTYAGTVARYFDADLRTLGISGNGLVGWVLGGPTLYKPQANWSVKDNSYYGGSLSVEGTGIPNNQPADHDAEPADIVLINLGTNDSGSLFNNNPEWHEKGCSSKGYQAEYLRFLKEIHEDCPDAVVVCMLGIALDISRMFPLIKDAAAEANLWAGKEFAYFLKLPHTTKILPDNKGLGYGNAVQNIDSVHPSVEGHEAYGRLIIDFLKDKI